MSENRDDNPSEMEPVQLEQDPFLIRVKSLILLIIAWFPPLRVIDNSFFFIEPLYVLSRNKKWFPFKRFIVLLCLIITICIAQLMNPWLLPFNFSSYLVLTGKHLEPGEPFKVAVTLFKNSNRRSYSMLGAHHYSNLPATIQVQIARKGAVIISEIRECHYGSTELITVKVSDTVFHVCKIYMYNENIKLR